MFSDLCTLIYIMPYRSFRLCGWKLQSHVGPCQQLQRGFASLVVLLSLLQLLYYPYYLCFCTGGP